ncbi:SMP-30/gluconolactonase/LRE family protein [Oleiagrimonas sp. C23AA]|uniref:SMP-30/gluconolactonase/LRE family protein n=1 Tax=Oleiagrimonas sp. C23AA TaxID=2719047 RepID=UPI001421F7CC|nr:SMP-30/gluconolactonase/LRE family protein [Oleiagrimonas sp. C23AA]NII12203.1 SMP-30/gluconolactonase/LRE family protein [Oleiagrimonas sp. C23AA]
MNARAEEAAAVANELGEGVLWCSQRQSLYWTDIHGAVLYTHEPALGHTRRHAMPERLACIALCEDADWLLLGLASRLAFWHIESGQLRELTTIEPELSTRLNDGACDREGRFVFGTLDEGQPQRAIGSYYRVNHDLSVERLPLPNVAISNSTAFSPDGRTMYFCDSPRRQIMAVDYAVDGHLGEPRVFVDLSDIDGVPDGSCVDAQGGLWNAQWGMRRVVRYLPDGQPERVIEVPTAQPTRPAFGGADLRTLFITSAREGLSEKQLQSDAGAGNLWRMVTDIRGLAESRFAGSPAAVSSHAG